MRTRFRIATLWLALGTLALLAPVRAIGAQAAEDDPSDLLLRIDGPLRVAAAESVFTAVVISSDADVAGLVREQLVVVGGTARVTGTVTGDVTIVNGRLELGPRARVDGDVYLHRSVLERAPAAVIGGRVEESQGFAFGQLLAWGIWVSLTVVAVGFGLVVAALAGHQLREAAEVLSDQPGPAVLGSVAVWGGLPLLASMSFATVIGIPLGFFILFVVLPILGLVGYVVTGTALGGVVLRRRIEVAHPYAEVAVGVLVLQAIGFVPIVGAMLVLTAGAYGAGALAYRTWRQWRGEARPAPVPVASG